MKNKILLILPRDTREVFAKTLRVPGTTLDYIASITPDIYEVEVVKEDRERVDFDRECDLVGISCMTSNAIRGYQVATEFKNRGKTVVFGGIHPSLMPNEALKYGDSVVVGEAEGSWEALLSDYQRNTLMPVYEKKLRASTSIPALDIGKNSSSFFFKPILTTRGCPYDCDFCSVTRLYGRTLRHVPIDEVVSAISASKEKRILFLDDNIVGSPEYSRSLFKAIAPLNIQWIGQSSLSIGKDYELLKLAQQSGCKGLFVGVESVTAGQLKSMNKSPGNLATIEEAIRKIEDLGIIFHPALVLGFDHDTHSVFNDTYEFLVRNKISSMSLSILTPYPGTRIFNQLKEENRIITENWQYYDNCTVVFQPKAMSPLALAEGYAKINKEFYTMSSIGKRLIAHMDHPLLHIVPNIAYRRTVRKNIAYRDKNTQDILNMTRVR